jgi:hypothetical protein
MNRNIAIAFFALLLQGVIASSTECPASQPIDNSPCSPLLADVICEYDQFCCGDDAGACVPKTHCQCNGNVFSCYDSPRASLPCLEMCPVVPPTTDDSCDIDDRYLCVYGDAFVCDETGETFDYEKQCSCDNGSFYCITNSCPVTSDLESCPVDEPVPGADCSPFVDFTCDYGEFCCQDQEGGESECVPSKTCYCDASDLKMYCFEPIISCPSVCPTTKPPKGSACDLSERFYCAGYAPTDTCLGDDFIEDVSCSCIDGSFTCQDYCIDSPPSSSPVSEPTSSNGGDDEVEKPSDVIVVTSSGNMNGMNGKNGMNGTNGKNGQNGTNGKKKNGDTKNKKKNNRKLGKNRRIRGGSGDMHLFGNN